MAFAQGTRTGLAIVSESTFGVTPSAPSFVTVPYNTHSLNLSKQRLTSDEILSDRMPRIDRHGNKNVGGDVTCELRPTDYDTFLESAFFSSFSSAGVMKIGTTPSYFSIEESALDITQFRVYSGLAVSTMSLSVAPNQLVNTTFSCVGKGLTQSGTALDSTPSAASGNQPFDSYSGSISIGGSQVSTITSIDFSLSNSLAPLFVVGSDETPQLEYQRAVVEGTVTAYYQDATLVNLFTNETTSSIELVLDDNTSGSTYTFNMGSVKFNGGDIPVQGPGARTLTLPFSAIYNSGQATNLSVTKT